MSDDAVVLPHPLVDASGPGWAATFADAPLVGLNGGRSALFVDSVRAGARVVVVTRPGARITLALHQMLDRTGGLWLTRDDDGVLRNAVSATVCTSIEGAVAGEAEQRPYDVDALADVPGRLAPEALRPTIGLTVSVHHPAREETLLGGTVVSGLDALVPGAAPTWGTAEPVSVRWDRAEITRLTRGRMPRETRLMVSGPSVAPFAATVRVARSEIGVTEETRILVPVDNATGAQADAVAGDLLTRLADRSQVLMGTAWLSRGAADATIAPYWPSLPQPLAAVIGARGVRSIGVDVPAVVREVGAIRIGARRAPSVLFPFGADEVRWQNFVAAIRAAGDTRVFEALLPTGLVQAGGRRAP